LGLKLGETLLEERLKPRQNQHNYIGTNIKMIFGIQTLFSKPQQQVLCWFNVLCLLLASNQQIYIVLDNGGHDLTNST